MNSKLTVTKIALRGLFVKKYSCIYFSLLTTTIGFLAVPRSFREIFKIVYSTRGRFRTTRRSIKDSLRLAHLAKELVNTYIEVIEWCGEKRVLKLKK